MAGLAVAPSASIQPVVGITDFMREALLQLSANTTVNIDSCNVAACSYYHYRCCGEEDTNWGCAYRALQTLLSAIISTSNDDNTATTASSNNNGNSKDGENLLHEEFDKLNIIENSEELTEVPSIKDIQAKLNISKPTQWIDPDYAHKYCGIYRIDGRVDNVRADDEQEMLQLEKSLNHHFMAHKLPVMIDDDIYAYILAGVALVTLSNSDAHVLSNNKLYVLVLDPHNTKPLNIHDYKTLITPQLTQPFTISVHNALKVAVEGLDYTGGDVIGANGVYWVPYDVMLQRGSEKHWKIYFPYSQK